MHPSSAKSARVSTPHAYYPSSMHRAAGGLWQAMAPAPVHLVAAAPVRPVVIKPVMDRVWLLGAVEEDTGLAVG